MLLYKKHRFYCEGVSCIQAVIEGISHGNE